MDPMQKWEMRSRMREMEHRIKALESRLEAYHLQLGRLRTRPLSSMAAFDFEVMNPHARRDAFTSVKPL